MPVSSVELKKNNSNNKKPFESFYESQLHVPGTQSRHSPNSTVCLQVKFVYRPICVITIDLKSIILL